MIKLLIFLELLTEIKLPFLCKTAEDQIANSSVQVPRIKLPFPVTTAKDQIAVSI